MADAYQAIARKILKARGRPMSAREILEEAQKYGLLPDHLHGATMHKTLWPAPGSEDTELGVLMEPEVGHGETEVYTRVQA
jgi:hypothetical protein